MHQSSLLTSFDHPFIVTAASSTISYHKSSLTMSYELFGTDVTPPGGDLPLYRISPSSCRYNAYTDDTNCSCIIYTDIYNDRNTICQTSSGQTAYYWTSRVTCVVMDTTGESVKLIDQSGSFDSMTGSQYCSGIFQSNPQVLMTTLSMPVGPDTDTAVLTVSATSTGRATTTRSAVGSPANLQTGNSGPSKTATGPVTTVTMTTKTSDAGLWEFRSMRMLMVTLLIFFLFW
jgi:hypothetical protein